MKRGQTTLEYILLIGIAAVGLIAMLVYISRGHQGNLRSQADQLSTGQYAPGNTIIDNHEIKTLNSTAGAGSSTTTKNSENPVGQTITDLELALQGIYDAYTGIYNLRQFWETYVVGEAIVQAATVAADVSTGNFSWTFPEGGISSFETQLTEDTTLGDAYTFLNTTISAWPARDPNVTTSSTSWSSESGRAETHKQISETLGNL